MKGSGIYNRSDYEKICITASAYLCAPADFQEWPDNGSILGGTNRRLSGGIFHDRTVYNSIQESAAENVCLEIFGDLCRNLRSFPFVFLLQHDV